MPYTEQGKAVMLWGLASAISHMSLHSGPADEGHELRGGVYRRLQVDFTTPDEGEMRSTRKVSFEVPEGAVVKAVGFWTTSQEGVMLAWGALPEIKTRGRAFIEVDLAELDLNCEPA